MNTRFFSNKNQGNKKKPVFVFGLTILFFILFSIGCDSQDPSSSKDAAKGTEEKAKQMPPEQGLAVLDAGAFVDTTDIKVIRMKTLLNNLSANYSEPRDTIAEYTSRAQGVLHDNGIQESCLNILEEMNKGGKIENTKYSEAITLYLMIRVKQ